jgi:iron complex outermembrane receptor protein
LSGNPLFPASIQQIMTATKTPSINIGRLQSVNDGLPPRTNNVLSKNVFGMGGISGSVLGLDWSANYIYSVSKQHVTNRFNTSQIKFAAAVDAVTDPVSGRVVCQVSLTQYAGLFPGCEPLNVFGPTAPSASAYDWITDDTTFTLTNRMKDANFSIAGSPFSLWAGPVRFAITGEYRALSLRNRSSVEAATPPDCTGLRANCTPTTTAWQHDVSSSMYAKQNVKELAGELLIPLLKDFPLAQSLELNLAGRYTDYSTSGSVKTWKAGLTWQVVDGLRFRASRSRDIRAPTLQDLFAPVSVRPTGYTDLHTNILRVINLYSQGNADLVPEVANTTTVGVVLQPQFLSNFSLAIDLYKIRIGNAIISASGFSTDIQRECENSNGASPFCDLFDRPLPFSDRTPANFPTRVFSRNINAARQWTKGVDVEANYRFDLANVAEKLPGTLRIRALVSYQPTLKRQTISTVPATESAGIAGMSKVNANLGVDFTNGGLNVAVTERWQSNQHQSDPAINYDLRPDIPAYSYTDISLNYDIKVGDHSMVPFMTVENLFNKKPPIVGVQNNVPGLFFPGAPGFDIIGRYFTTGIRARF